MIPILNEIFKQVLHVIATLSIKSDQLYLLVQCIPEHAYKCPRNKPTIDNFWSDFEQLLQKFSFQFY